MCKLQLRVISDRGSAPSGVEWYSVAFLFLRGWESRLLCHQIAKRLVSTLLLVFAARGWLQNSDLNLAALGHQPSQGLAQPNQTQIHNHPREVLQCHHTFTHVKEHWIHAAMLTMHSWSRTLAKAPLPQKAAAVIHSYYDTEI